MATIGWRAKASVVATVLVAVGLTAAACGDDSADGLPPASSPQPTPAATATLDPEEAAVLAAFEAYLQAATAAKVESDLSLEGLEELVTPTFLDIFRGIIGSDLDDNRRYEGTIEVVSVEVAEHSVDASGPAMALDVCMDGSNFVPVDIDTGELNGDDPREYPSRHLSRHWFRTNDQGEWVVDAVNLPNWFFGEREEAAKEC